jgi:hypothetical protein
MGNDMSNHGWWWGGAMHVWLFWIVLTLAISTLTKRSLGKPMEPVRGRE